MKKIIALTAIIGLSLFAWLYLANNFEKRVYSEILPKLQQEELLSANKDSVTIDKFFFSITINDVELFPKNKNFSISTDQITIKAHPIKKNLAVHFNSEKIIVMTGKESFYSKTPVNSVTLDVSGLESNFEDIQLEIKAKTLQLYNSKNDDLISDSNNMTLKLSSLLEADNLQTIGLDAKFTKLNLNPESTYLIDILNNLENTEFTELKNKIIQAIKVSKIFYKLYDDIDYKLNFSTKLAKKYWDALFAFSPENPSSIAELMEFDFQKDTYAIHAQELFTAKLIKGNSFLDLSSDGEKISIDADIVLTQSSGEKNKKQLASILEESLLNEKKQSADQNSLDDEVIKNISVGLSELSRFALTIKSNYTIEPSDFENQLKLAINNFNTEINTAYGEKSYNGSATISTPTILINGVVNFYKSIFKPSLMKEVSKNLAYMDEKLSLQKVENYYDAVVENIKNNGFEALSAFHQEQDLSKDDDLMMNFVADFNSFNFSINDRGFTEYLTNDKILKFLSEMPEDLSKTISNNKELPQSTKIRTHSILGERTAKSDSEKQLSEDKMKEEERESNSIKPITPETDARSENDLKILIHRNPDTEQIDPLESETSPDKNLAPQYDYK